MGLQSFERALENMVEVVFSRSSRSTIRPVELGRRLLREMDDHRSVDVKGRRMVPNAFAFHLSPRDHAGFEEIDQALVHELCEAAREYARDEGYHFIGPVSVELTVDNALKAGRFGIVSHLRETAGSDGARLSNSAAPDMGFAIAEPPASIAPIEPTSFDAPSPRQPVGVSQGRLLLPSGERLVVSNSAITMGRLPECTVTLTDPNVSREHAEVRPGAEIVIVDLGSTNGTKVNGLRIDGPRVLVDGDIISLGSTHLRFEAAPSSA